MLVKIFFGAAAALLSLAGASARAWTPDPAQVRRLAAPVSVGGFQVRPPQGYEARTLRAGKGPAFTWWGPPRPRGLRPFLIFGRFVPDAAQAGGRTLVQMLREFSASDANIYAEYRTSPIESGTINGVPFARLRWSGTDPRTHSGLRGFDYLGRGGGPFFSGGGYFLMGAKVRADDPSALALAEASALTFRVKVKQ